MNIYGLVVFIYLLYGLYLSLKKETAAVVTGNTHTSHLQRYGYYAISE